MKKDEFISVIKENRNLIYKVCYTYCSDKENRKDLQQEVLMQLWLSFSKFDGRVKISTWIYRVAFNTAISFYRSDSKYSGRNTSIDESVISLSDADYSPERDQNVAKLYEFIGNLNELDKALILLYLDDKKQKDISDILGISETNVATKISRIKQKLKEQFNKNQSL